MTDQELREHKLSHNKTNSWWLKDYRGIECSRVCEVCQKAVMDTYAPGTFDDRYDEVMSDEQIEADY